MLLMSRCQAEGSPSRALRSLGSVPAHGRHPWLHGAARELPGDGWAPAPRGRGRAPCTPSTASHEGLLGIPGSWALPGTSWVGGGELRAVTATSPLQ